MKDLGNMEIMAQNIKEQMRINNKKAVDVCNDLNIKKNTFSDWVNAKTYPRIDKIEQMAKYFHCTKSALVEEHNINNVDYVIPELNAVVNSMTNTQKQNLYTYALFLLNKEPAVLDKEHPITMQVSDGEKQLIEELRKRTEIDHKTLEEMFNAILKYKQDQKTITFTDQKGEHAYYMISVNEFLGNK